MEMVSNGWKGHVSEGSAKRKINGPVVGRSSRKSLQIIESGFEFFRSRNNLVHALGIGSCPGANKK